MPRQGKTQAEVVCPKCGHRFHLDDQVTAHIHEAWERDAKQRLRRELREEADARAEERIRGEFAKQLRDKDEEAPTSGRWSGIRQAGPAARSSGSRSADIGAGATVGPESCEPTNGEKDASSV